MPVGQGRGQPVQPLGVLEGAARLEVLGPQQHQVVLHERGVQPGRATFRPAPQHLRAVATAQAVPRGGADDVELGLLHRPAGAVGGVTQRFPQFLFPLAHPDGVPGVGRRGELGQPPADHEVGGPAGLH